MKNLLKNKPLLVPLGVLSLSLMVYLLGFKILFIPVLLGCVAWYVPFPRVLRSFVSRCIAAIVVVYSLLMIVDLLQFSMFGESGFKVVAALITLFVGGVIAVLWQRTKPESVVWFDRKDAAALLVAACFLLPATVATGVYRGDIIRIAKFGALQSSDGAGHFTILSEVSGAGHLTYRTNSYYPRGFHLNTAFVQDSFYLNQSTNSFRTNVQLFAVQYLVFGSLLAYLLFYLSRMVADGLGTRLQGRANFLLALTLAFPLALFYLLPFVFQGFLSSYYATVVMVCAVMYLHEFYLRRNEKDMYTKRWFLICYLLFALSVSMSWTLLLPPLLFIPLLYLLPDTLRWRNIPGLVGQALSHRNWPVIIAFLLTFVPIYLHLRYATLSGEQWFNAQGSIRSFHLAVFLAGAALVLYLSLHKSVPEQLRRLANNVFLPFFAFLALLMVIQFFLIGDIRYYVIKSSFSVEMLLLAFAAAVIVYAYAADKLGQVQAFCMPILTLTVGLLFLISININPLKDVREMFRDYSGFGKPAFFDSDIAGMVKLAQTGQVYSANAIVAHYDPLSGNLSSNMTNSYWVSVMQREPAFDMQVEICKASLFTVAVYQEVTPEQQAAFKSKVLECASLAKGQGRKYFIVTDGASAPYMQKFFGDNVSVVVQ